VGTLPLAFALKVSEGVILCPHEASGVAFALPLSIAFGAFVELEVPSVPSYWPAGEAVPSAPCAPELKVDMLGGFFL
jgi:hypothetical protein